MNGSLDKHTANNSRDWGLKTNCIRYGAQHRHQLLCCQSQHSSLNWGLFNIRWILTSAYKPVKWPGLWRLCWCEALNPRISVETWWGSDPLEKLLSHNRKRAAFSTKGCHTLQHRQQETAKHYHSSTKAPWGHMSSCFARQLIIQSCLEQQVLVPELQLS